MKSDIPKARASSLARGRIDADGQTMLCWQGGCAPVAEARGFFARLIGLTRVHTAAGRQALLFRKCRSVHTLGMHIDIGVVGLSADLTVTEALVMEPGRVHMFRADTRHIAELVGVGEGELPKAGERLVVAGGDAL